MAVTISKLALFDTPKTIKEITDHIERCPKDQQINLHTVMGMTWNYLAEMTNVDLNGKLPSTENDHDKPE